VRHAVEIPKPHTQKISVVMVWYSWNSVDPCLNLA